MIGAIAEDAARRFSIVARGLVLFAGIAAFSGRS